MSGGELSTTLTVNVQLEPDPASVQVTLLVPTGKNDNGGG
jgi:hypothetical protein